MYKTLANSNEIQCIIKNHVIFYHGHDKVFPGSVICVFSKENNFDLLCTVDYTEGNRLIIGRIEIMRSLFCTFETDYTVND